MATPVKDRVRDRDCDPIIPKSVRISYYVTLPPCVTFTLEDRKTKRGLNISLNMDEHADIIAVLKNPARRPQMRCVGEYFSELGGSEPDLYQSHSESEDDRKQLDVIPAEFEWLGRLVMQHTKPKDVAWIFKPYPGDTWTDWRQACEAHNGEAFGVPVTNRALLPPQRK